MFTKITPTKPILFIDTREQNPLFNHRHHNRFHLITRATVKTGDYTIYGHENRLCFERKSLQDLIGTLSKGKDRFERELDRMSYFDYAAIVIEDTFKKVANPYGFSKMNPHSVIGILQAISLRYGIHIIFSGDRHGAEDFMLAQIERSFYAR